MHTHASDLAASTCCRSPGANFAAGNAALSYSQILTIKCSDGEAATLAIEAINGACLHADRSWLRDHPTSTPCPCDCSASRQ